MQLYLAFTKVNTAKLVYDLKECKLVNCQVIMYNLITSVRVSLYEQRLFAALFTHCLFQLKKRFTMILYH